MIDLDQIAFPPEIVKELKAKELRGTIAFMVYDTKFWNYYHDYPALKKTHNVGLILALCFFSCNLYFYTMIHQKW